MKHFVYVICEPGMDRPCVQSSEPSEHQRKRNAAQLGIIYEREIDLPGVEIVDGQIVVTTEGGR